MNGIGSKKKENILGNSNAANINSNPAPVLAPIGAPKPGSLAPVSASKALAPLT